MHGRKDMEGEELLQGIFEQAQRQVPEEEEELLQGPTILPTIIY